MDLKQALAILTREKHNGYAQWDGTCPEGNPAFRTEFECIAIAEAYERRREPNPCVELRDRLKGAEVALRKALAICEVMYIGAGDTGTAGQFEAWGELVGYFRAALGAAGEEKDKGCQD